MVGVVWVQSGMLEISTCTAKYTMLYSYFSAQTLYLTNLRKRMLSLFAGCRWKTSGSRMFDCIVFMKRIDDTTKLVARISCRQHNTSSDHECTEPHC